MSDSAAIVALIELKEQTIMRVVDERLTAIHARLDDIEMRIPAPVTSELEAVQSDLALLRADLDTLHVVTEAGSEDGVEETIEDAEESTEEAIEDASDAIEALEEDEEDREEPVRTSHPLLRRIGRGAE